MSRLSILISVVALGVSGWFAWNASCLRCELKDLRADLDAQAALDGRLSALEKKAAKTEVALAEVAAPRAATAPKPDVTEGATLASAARGAGPAASAAKTTAVVDALEKRIAALERSGTPARQIDLGHEGRSLGALRMPFYGSLDDAARDLDLSAGQKSDFERAVADAKRDLDDLHKTTDDDGKTWDEAQKDTFKMEGGGFKFDTTKLEAFKAKNVPGRGETFGAADKRIREQAKSRMRGTLSSDQQAKFDKAMVDPLIGGGSGGISFMTTGVTLDVAGDGK